MSHMHMSDSSLCTCICTPDGVWVLNPGGSKFGIGVQ